MYLRVAAAHGASYGGRRRILFHSGGGVTGAASSTVREVRRKRCNERVTGGANLTVMEFAFVTSCPR